MVELVIKLFDQLNSSVFTLIVILIAMFWLMYKAGEVVHSFKEQKKKNNKFEKNIETIKDSLASIKAIVELLYQDRTKSPVANNSPLRLTKIGQDIAREIKLKEKLSLHWRDIIQALEERGLNDNPYDIQVTSMDVAQHCFEQIFDSIERDNIKKYAFKQGMNLLEIYPVIGVAIRDTVLKEKGIALDEIDKNSPKNN